MNLMIDVNASLLSIIPRGAQFVPSSQQKSVTVHERIWPEERLIGRLWSHYNDEVGEHLSLREYIEVDSEMKVTRHRYPSDCVVQLEAGSNHNSEHRRPSGLAMMFVVL